MANKFYVHESSIIDKTAKIGDGTKVWHFSHISDGAQIGSNCNIGQNCYVGNDVKIGNNCKLQNNVSVYTGVELQDYVFCGPSMVFTNDLTPRCKYPKHGEYKKTLVCEGATIGANATIVCNTTIGKHALVGAGAVVTKDIPDHAIVVGNPARVIGYACECGTKVDPKTKICPRCGTKI